MKKILVVSHIENEVNKIKNILGIEDIVFLSLDDIGCEVTYNEILGFTLCKNVEMVAKKYYDLYNIPVITYDSGLEIEALNGFPSLFTNKMYNEYTALDINHSIIKNLENESNKNAFYTSYICYYDGYNFTTINNKIIGKIMLNPNNSSNPISFKNIFFSDDLNKYLDEVSLEELESIHPFNKSMKELSKVLRYSKNNSPKYNKKFNHLSFYKIEDFININDSNTYIFIDKDKTIKVGYSYFKNINTGEIFKEDFLGNEYLKELSLGQIETLGFSELEELIEKYNY